MKGGWLRYKCRMCGEEYQNIHAPNVSIVLTAIVLNNLDLIKEWFGVVPHILDLHYHNDGSQGVADLMGGIEDKE